MSWFCASGGGGVAGIAWVGTLCMKHKGFMTNLNEKQRTAAATGLVSFILLPRPIKMFFNDKIFDTRFPLIYTVLFLTRFTLMSLDTISGWAMTLTENTVEKKDPATTEVS